MGPTSYQLTFFLFHVNRPSHSWEQIFQNLTFKIQNQSHGWVQSSKSRSGSDFLYTHIPFIPYISHPIPWIRLFWRLTLKIQGKFIAQGQSGSHSLMTHIQCRQKLSWFIRHLSDGLYIFHTNLLNLTSDIWAQSSEMSDVFRLHCTSLSFHVNRLSHSGNDAFLKSDLENPSSRS